MDRETFKIELFSKLYAGKNSNRPRLFSIGKNMFSEETGDMRDYMALEIQTLVMQKPYCVEYLECESTAEMLSFLDINPVIVDNGNEVVITNYRYDCDKRMIVTLDTSLQLKSNNS